MKNLFPSATNISPIDISTVFSIVFLCKLRLRQGKKLYENTSVLASLDTARESSRIYLTTQFGTKKGEMALSGLLTAAK